MSARKGWLAIGLVVLTTVATVVGCRDRNSGSRDPDEVVLKTYDLPETVDRDVVQSRMRSTFKTGDVELAGVSLGPGNSLIVTGPGSVQEGVATVIAKYVEAAEGQSPPASVAVDYWAVLGRPSASPEARPNALERLAPVLDEIVAQQGPTRFLLLEHLRVTGVEGSDARLRGRYVSVEQRLIEHPSAGRLADVRLSMPEIPGARYSLASRIELQPDRFVVLGQTAYDGRYAPGEMEGEGLQLYYVIAAD